MYRLLLLSLIACTGCAAMRSTLREPRAVPGAAGALRAARRMAVLVVAEAESDALGRVPVGSPVRALRLREQAAAAAGAVLARSGVEVRPVDGGAEGRQVSILLSRMAWSATSLEPPDGVEHPFVFGLGDIEPFLAPAQADHLLVISTSIEVLDGGGSGPNRQVLRAVLGVCDRRGNLLWVRFGMREFGRERLPQPEVGWLVRTLAADLWGER